MLGLDIFANRFAKRVTGGNNLEYEQRLMVLKLSSLKHRKATGDVVETFKIIHFKNDPETVCSLFKVSEYGGASRHLFKLRKKTFLTNQYKHCFTNRVINNSDWNNLPSDIVLISRNTKLFQITF